MFLDSSDGFIDQTHEWSFEANAPDDIQRGAVPPLSAFVLDEIDTAARMPRAGILTEQKESGHVRRGSTAGVVQEVIRLCQNVWRFTIVLDLICETFHGIGIQIIPGGVQRLLSFVNDGSFGFLEILDLFSGKRRCLRGYTAKRTSAGDAMHLKTRNDFKFENEKIAQLKFFRGRMESRHQKVLQRLKQIFQLATVVRDSGDAFIRLDAHKKRASVRVRHARKNANNF